MTPRQKRIIGVLAIANGAVILALALFVVRFSSVTSVMPLPWSAPPHSPAGPEEALYPEACQRRAVQLLSQAGLGGTAAVLSGETLQLDLVYPIPKDQDAEEAAQQVWTAFDIARALSQDQCGNFSRVTVVIQAQGARGDAVTQGSIQIHASVDTTDLEALHNGELSEGEFIDRVQYEAH